MVRSEALKNVHGLSLEARFWDWVFNFEAGTPYCRPVPFRSRQRLSQGRQLPRPALIHLALLAGRQKRPMFQETGPEQRCPFKQH